MLPNLCADSLPSAPRLQLPPSLAKLQELDLWTLFYIFPRKNKGEGEHSLPINWKQKKSLTQTIKVSVW